eukprot:CAMPEP_0170554014 /NCGR_PEP_ID=MMETSP0211-20121228/11878_1 /TAXON_ID=311385 /ORGANISM="Pseudokeronopsis sp., Strain OXSARD2" /LENGTH=76 /DNA_ID=CAMNT_0010862779 /DNA_START=402 /DNA_END=631 /DNA_ORIENTATION=+
MVVLKSNVMEELIRKDNKIIDFLDKESAVEPPVLAGPDRGAEPADPGQVAKEDAYPVWEQGQPQRHDQHEAADCGE